MKNINPSVIEAKFKRSNLNLVKTKLWKTLETSQQQLILSEIKQIDSDRKFICFYNYNYWWLLTNKDLVISDNGNVLCIGLFEISKIELSADIKSMDSTEVIFDVFYKDEIIKLQIEKSSWPIVIEILKFVTTAIINIKS